jgi:hypothetical protein
MEALYLEIIIAELTFICKLKGSRLEIDPADFGAICVAC